MPTKDPAYYAAWRAANREKAKATAAAWRAANPEKVKQNRVAYKDRATEVNREWYAAHPEYAKTKNALRRARIANPAPWADIDLIRDINEYARIMREAGVDCHVDHEIPLRGKHVSGLHVHTNLTVLLAEDNIRKGNRAP